MRVVSPDAQREERCLSEKGGCVHSCNTLSPKNPTLSAVPGCASPVDCGLRTIRCATLEEEEENITGKKKIPEGTRCLWDWCPSQPTGLQESLQDCWIKALPVTLVLDSLPRSRNIARVFLGSPETPCFLTPSQMP